MCSWNEVWRGMAMRTAMILGVLAVVAGQEGADPLAKRFGYDVNENRYAQKSPEDALKSVIAAIESKKIDYLVAHLADPAFVDTRIKEYVKGQTGSDEARTFRAFTR